MELENIVANTVYLKAREGKNTQAWSVSVEFTSIHTCEIMYE